VEHLRLVIGKPQVADVRAQVALSPFIDCTQYTPPRTRATRWVSYSSSSWPGARRWSVCVPAEQARTPQHDDNNGGPIEQPGKGYPPP
jgi:hypothetical protein